MYLPVNDCVVVVASKKVVEDGYGCDLDLAAAQYPANRKKSVIINI